MCNIFPITLNHHAKESVHYTRQHSYALLSKQLLAGAVFLNQPHVLLHLLQLVQTLLHFI
jgi:hypothetical protein